METFIFQELAAFTGLHTDYNLFHYRDYKKHEVDFLIERDDGAIAGIEVKASHSVSKDDFAPQIWFRENIIKNKSPFTALVIYSGEDTLSFGDGLLAIPAASLWL